MVLGVPILKHFRVSGFSTGNFEKLSNDIHVNRIVVPHQGK